MHILDKIIAHKRKEVEQQKAACPVAELEQSTLFNRDCLSLRDALIKTGDLGIIAEFKRRSPSKSWINKDANPIEVIPAYEAAGAAAISVLTDQHFFGGSNDFLRAARTCCTLPLLRKDFTISEYQIIEAKSIGADAILLIAAVLTKAEIQRFTRLAHSLSLSVLIEVHAEEELQKIPEVVDVIGVNNRDLKHFTVDIDRSIRLKSQLPDSAVHIAESGLKKAETIARMRAEGFDGFLIGETFMREVNPGAKCEATIAEVHALEPLSTK